MHSQAKMQVLSLSPSPLHDIFVVVVVAKHQNFIKQEKQTHNNLSTKSQKGENSY
jgi:hypothetical protein